MPRVPRALCLVALALVGCLETPISDECPAGSVVQGKECVRNAPGGAAGSAGAAGAGGAGTSAAGGGGATSVGCSCPSDRPFCDAQGECVQCVSAPQCPKPASECVTALCTNGTCATLPAKQGAPVTKQTAGDCTRIQCNGLGGEEAVADASDLPPDDGAPCTSEACEGMAPVHPFKGDGEVCAGGTCNGKGACVECAPGQKRCFENAPQTCSADGKWVGDAKCAAPVPACSAGGCVGVKEVSASSAAACALLSDGTVRCWGLDGSGELGTGVIGKPVLRPTPMLGVTDAIHVVTQAGETCVTRADGGVLCFGRNDWGQLGDGTQVASATGTTVKGVKTGAALALSGTHACALTSVGPVACWGRGVAGEIGLGDTDTVHATPATLGQGSATSLAVAARAYGGLYFVRGHSCAVFADGTPTLRCWGDDTDGQLGLGSFQSTAAPTPVMAVAAGTKVSAGPGYTCAAPMPDGGARCWGINDEGQLGLGVIGPAVNTPQTPLGQDKGVEAVVAGPESACAIHLGGESVCWGRNRDGMLATPTQDEYLPPTKTTLPPVSSLVLGSAFACALFPDGAVRCWGNNENGQLGDATQKSRTTPAEVLW